MQFNDYSIKAISTLTDKQSHQYGDVDARLMSQVLGLSGEAGEVVEKFKKILRDKSGMISEDDHAAIIKELGDVLWYVNSISHLLGSSLEEVAQKNNDKLLSRQSRRKIHGSGDDR
ncbi:MAG: hypothetical protein D8G53_07850 [Candidatus Saccharimonas sp.]|nr:MAG: hypothetical protein D8G53_07850 [Candidatus Saccharimonas sp.]